MAQLRDPKVNALAGLEQKLRATSVLRFRDERVTADGIDVVAVDPQTGQIALITVSPINQGQCPLCSHVAHQDANRCEAIAASTKEPCECRPFYGRFPAPNRTQDELDGKVRPAWMGRR
jgi:hypothetical protein